MLQLARIDKPALLRRLFVLGCAYSGQILSYQKMIGQLQDVGNTTTLAHYLELLGGAWMLTGLDKPGRLFEPTRVLTAVLRPFSPLVPCPWNDHGRVASDKTAPQIASPSSRVLMDYPG